jgi:hypothetical protein
MTTDVVVVDDVVVGPGAGTLVVVVDVVGVTPLGPDGVLVSHPAITAHSRSPGTYNLRIAIALSDRPAIVSTATGASLTPPRRSNRDLRPG